MTCVCVCVVDLCPTVSERVCVTRVRPRVRLTAIGVCPTTTHNTKHKSTTDTKHSSTQTPNKEPLDFITLAGGRKLLLLLFLTGFPAYPRARERASERGERVSERARRTSAALEGGGQQTGGGCPAPSCQLPAVRLIHSSVSLPAAAAVCVRRGERHFRSAEAQRYMRSETCGGERKTTNDAARSAAANWAVAKALFCVYGWLVFRWWGGDSYIEWRTQKLARVSGRR